MVQSLIGVEVEFLELIHTNDFRTSNRGFFLLNQTKLNDTYYEGSPSLENFCARILLQELSNNSLVGDY